MFSINQGIFKDAHMHHDGWFRVFRGDRFVEVWFGNRWVMVDWS